MLPSLLLYVVMRLFALRQKNLQFISQRCKRGKLGPQAMHSTSKTAGEITSVCRMLKNHACTSFLFLVKFYKQGLYVANH